MSSVPIEELRRHWQERIPFNRLCGFVVSRWDDTGVRMEVDDAEGLANGVGSMHGGVVATLVDTVANAAAITLGDFGPGARVATVSMTVHYNRPAGDYGQWGLHMWGDAVDPAVLSTIAWDKPFQRTGMDSFGAVYEIPLVNDTAAVNFIMHLPSGDSVPSTREPGGDRSFVPLDHPHIYLRQGDPTIHFNP